jgi:hypothetical protein
VLFKCGCIEGGQRTHAVPLCDLFGIGGAAINLPLHKWDGTPAGGVIQSTFKSCGDSPHLFGVARETAIQGAVLSRVGKAKLDDL